MKTEENLDPEIEKLRDELIQAVGKFPLAAKDVPRDFRKKIVALLNRGKSGQILSKALGIPAGNLSHWKYEYREKPAVQELKIKPEAVSSTAIKITVTEAKKQFVIEGLCFAEVQILLKSGLA